MIVLDDPSAEIDEATRSKVVDWFTTSLSNYFSGQFLSFGPFRLTECDMGLPGCECCRCARSYSADTDGVDLGGES